MQQLERNFHLTYAVIFFPLLVLLMAMLGLGLGLIITALTTKYRDLSFLVVFGVQLLMYANAYCLSIELCIRKIQRPSCS
jgi:lipopolysaccharide transport system permease protein